MSVIRVKHQKNYVVIHKGALENPKLSFKAKGLWAYCMSRPDDWEFHVSHLATVSKEKEDAIYSGIKELIDEGYCRKFQTNKGKGEGNGRGSFGAVDYEIYEEPVSNNFSQTDFPEAKDPLPSNPALPSIDVNQVMKDTNSVCTREREEEKLIPEIVKKKHPDGHEITINLSDIFHEALNKKKSWDTDLIQQSWKILVEYDGPIRIPFRFIEGTIEKLHRMKMAEKYSKKGKNACQQTKPSNISESEGKNSLKPPSGNFADLNTLKRLFPEL
jgi:hypothetical protein